MTIPDGTTISLPRRVPLGRGSLYITPHAFAAMAQWRRHPLRRAALLCDVPTPDLLIRLLDGLKGLP